MERNLKIYEKYSRGIALLMSATGLWPNFNPFISKFVWFIAAFSTLFETIAILNFCIHHVTNVMILTKGMGAAITFFTSFFKIIFLHFHFRDIVYLNEELRERFTNDLKDAKDRRLQLTRIKPFIFFFYWSTILSGLAVLTYIIAPLLALKHSHYLRCFPSVFPFTYQPGGIVHWCIYGIEFLGGFYLWTITNGSDSLFGLYALQLNGQLRILANRFKELRVCKDYSVRLRDCIERHQALIKCKNRLESIFGLLILWLAISSALVLCSLAFQVSQAIKTTMGPLQMSRLAFYIVPKLMQMFTYAWYGNLVTEESKLCLDALYNARWPEAENYRLKNDILIILAQRPMVIVAKGCFSIQLNLFSKIVQTTLSYFFLLQTLSESSNQAH